MAACALAQHPGMTETLTAVTRLLVLLFLVSSMSGIGLGLTLSQIIAPLRNVKLIVLAVITNFIIVRFWRWSLHGCCGWMNRSRLVFCCSGWRPVRRSCPKSSYRQWRCRVSRRADGFADGWHDRLSAGRSAAIDQGCAGQSVEDRPIPYLADAYSAYRRLIVRARAASIGARARPVFEGLSTGILLLCLSWS